MFIFKTQTTMKPYNCNRWWIDDDIIKEMRIDAPSVKDALEQYVKKVRDSYYIEISKNALKNKSEMFIDTKDGNTKQIGYVITAQDEFQDDCGRWSKQYIELWVEILNVSHPTF